MGDCHYIDGLPGMISHREIPRSIFFVASVLLVFLFFIPRDVHASTYISWGDTVYDDYTNEILSTDEIRIVDGGEYPVPLGISKDIFVNPSDTETPYYLQGHLYRIDSDTGGRIPLGLIGFGGVPRSAWDTYGSYEVDVFDLGLPVLGSRSLWNKITDLIFGPAAYAAKGDLVEVVHFTLKPEQGPNKNPELALLDNSSGVLPEKGSPNNTEFIFRVLYTDLDNTAPEFVNLLLDGGVYAMTRESGSQGEGTDGAFANGEVYTVHKNIAGLGEHRFSFTAFDGLATATLEAQIPIQVGASNVAFFPGVQSTYLYEDGFLSEDQLWLPNVGVGSTGDVEHLFMNPDGSSKRTGVYTKDNDIVLTAYKSPASGEPVYAGFPEALDTLVSSHVINSWKPIAYDWRLDLPSLLSSGRQTNDKISYLSATDTPYIYQELQKLADTSLSGKVSIVAHSNGGLLAKAFLADLEERHDPLLEKIDLLVLVASPQLGTPKALLPTLHGAENFLSKFPILLGDKTWRGATRYAPSAYNLLPSEKYFEKNELKDLGPVVVFDQSMDKLADTVRKRTSQGYFGSVLASVFDYRTRYGNQIATFTKFFEFLEGSEGRPEPAYEDVQHPTKLSTQLLNNTRALHRKIDAWVPPDLNHDNKPDIEVVQIVGWGMPTIKGVEYDVKRNVEGCVLVPVAERVVCEEFYGVQPIPLFSMMGDETVILGSANAMPVETWYFDLHTYNKNKALTGDLSERDHASIMAAQPVARGIENLIKGDSLSAIAYLSQQNPSAQDLIVLEMHSPVSLDVKDGEGGHIGLVADPISRTQRLDQTIPNSSYWKIGESTFIALDPTTTYTATLSGLAATGTFTFKIQKFKRDALIETTFFTDVPVTSLLKSTVVITPTSTPSALSLDTNGDGKIDMTVRSDSTKKTSQQLFEEFRKKIGALPSPADKGLKTSLKALSVVSEALVVGKKTLLARISFEAIELVIKGKTGHGISVADAKILLDILREIKNSL